MLGGFLSLVQRRAIRIWATILCTVLLGALLTATLYWTLFDPRWVAFLGGIVFAAVLAIASNASKAQWALMRRTRQLERVRAALAEEATRGRAALASFRDAELKLQALADAQPFPVLFLDRGEHCTVFNRALREWSDASEILPGGASLRDLVGAGAYEELHGRVAAALQGKPSSCDIAAPKGPSPASRARMIPYPPASDETAGVLLLLEPHPTTMPAAQAGPGPEPADGESLLYLRSITSELMGWDHPQAKLAAALRDDQFLLMGQKIAPLRAGLQQPMCEILLRLKEEEDNLLPPGGFIPVAEHYGMMEQIDRWVVRNVVSRGLQLKAQSVPVPLFCINLSSAAIASQGFARYVQDQAGKRGLEASALCFEIGESDVAALREDVRRLIGALKPLGCRFTVDAFGSTRASFAPLQGLAFDFIKIDGVIVQNILKNPAELAKARAIATVCRKTGILSIGEFVEDEMTWAALEQIGVDYVQGFGVARPERLEPAAMAVA